MEEFARQYRNPLFNAAITFTEPLPLGLLAAAGCAAVLRRKGTEGQAAVGSTGARERA